MAQNEHLKTINFFSYDNGRKLTKNHKTILFVGRVNKKKTLENSKTTFCKEKLKQKLYNLNLSSFYYQLLKHTLNIIVKTIFITSHKYITN